MTVWQDTAYILALDKEVAQNSLNWIVVVDSEGNTIREISYKTKSSSPEDGWESGNDIVDIEVDGNGGIWLLEETSGFQFDDAGRLIQERMEYNVISLDEEGNVLDTYDLTDINDTNSNGETPFVHNFITDNEGNFYFLCEIDASSSLYIYDNQGKFVSKLNGNVTAFSKSKNGQVLAQVDSGTGENELRTVDTVSWGWGESTQISQNYSFIYTGDSYDYLFNNGINLYGYDLESGKNTELLNWLDSDLTNGYIQCMGEMSNGRLFALATGLDDLKEDIVILEPVSEELMPERTVVTLAAGIASEELKTRVVEFNRVHSDCKIKLTEYSMYDTYNDSYAGQRQLFTEIISGEIPDIIDFYDFPADTLISAGLLEDLYPYLEQDAEISVDDFLPSLINALEVDGALYRLPYQFYLTLVAGDSEVVGTKQGWTIKDLYKIMEGNEQYQNVFHPSCTQADFLGYVIRLNSDKYINWQEGTCSFESEEFITLLQFAKDYFMPGDKTFHLHAADQVDTVSRGEQLLVLTWPGGIDEILICDEMFDGNVNFIGFPTEQGIGNAFVPCENFGITSTSEHKDIAWEFIRGFYLDGAFNFEATGFFFPSTMSGLEELINDTMEQSVDSDSIYDMPDDGDQSYEKYVLTQEKADMFWKLLLSVDRVYFYDHSIEEIVVEEANSYFYDDKSVEEAAKIIQNRVQTMLSEQS